jgi:hypothetical protein
MHIWIDAGDDDPFLDGDEAFEQALASSGVKAVIRDGPGGHDSDYWNGNWEEYLTFYSRSLRHCGDEKKKDGEKEKGGEKKPRGDEQGRKGDGAGKGGGGD